MFLIGWQIGYSMCELSQKFIHGRGLFMNMKNIQCPTYIDPHSEEIISEYHTGKSESEARFDKYVSFEHISDYLTSGRVVNTWGTTVVHCLSVEEMPIGCCEVYSGDLYVKNRPRYGTSRIAKAYRFYTQFDINIPRTTFDGSWEIQEAVDGQSMKFYNGVIDIQLESFCKDLSLMVLGGFSDNNRINIFIDENSHSLIEFNTFNLIRGHRQLRVVNSILSTKIPVENSYETITCIAYDIAFWLWKHRERDDVYIPESVMRNIYHIAQSYPIMSVHTMENGEFDQWNITKFDSSDHCGTIRKSYRNGEHPFDFQSPK